MPSGGQKNQPHSARRRTSRAWVALLLAAAVIVGLPLLAVAIGLISKKPDPSAQAAKPLPWLFAKSLVWSGLVGFFAVILAIGPAWLARAWWGSNSRWRRLGPALLIPLFSPSYLAYSGWQLLRAPGTWLGDWLERQSAQSDTAALAFGRGLAVGGLALWAWPVAMLLLVPAFRRVHPQTVEAMQLDGISGLKRIWHVGVIVRRGLLTAWTGVTLLMLGSAVPFQLAQVPTYAIEVWTQLDQHPGQLKVWIFAWPIVVICIAAAAWIAWGQTREHAQGDESPSPEPDQLTSGNAIWSRWATITALTLSVAAPLVLFATHLHSWGSVGRYLRETAQAIAAATIVSVSVGLATMVSTLLSWWAFSISRPGPIARMASAFALSLFLLGLVLPGILIGSAVLRAVTTLASTWPVLAWLQDSSGALIWGHLVRFGALGVLVGAMIAWSEGREVRDLRAIDGCGAWRAAWESLLRPFAGVILAVGVASGLLSLYEIEATILLIPPGPGSLSHTILAYLHFARDEQLCAAGVAVIGSGVAIALLAALVAGVNLGRLTETQAPT